MGRSYFAPGIDYLSVAEGAIVRIIKSAGSTTASSGDSTSLCAAGRYLVSNQAYLIGLPFPANMIKACSVNFTVSP